MINVNNASNILSMTDCWQLFTKEQTEAKAEYRAFSKQWHPDLNGQSEESCKVFQKINELYTQATKYFDLISGKSPSIMQGEVIPLGNNKGLSVNYFVKRDFELGTIYTGRTSIVIRIHSKHSELAHNAESVMTGFEYKNPDMQKEMHKYLPWYKKSIGCLDGRLIILDKSKDMVPMEALHKFYSEHIPDRHITWMIGKLLNVCCYLDIYGLSHNGITMQSCYVDAAYHTVGIYNGWQYCVPQGSKMLGTCKAVYDAMPLDVKNSRQGSIRTDLESIRKLALQLYNGNAPAAIREWIDKPSEDTALEAYESWFKHIELAYGKREFIVMDIQPEEVYTKYF